MNGVRAFGVARLAALLGIGAALIAGLIWLAATLGAEPKALLYSNLDLKEASTVVQALDQAGIDYEVKGDGSTIMVPRDKVASTRLMISGKGLVTSGSVGYEIFDQGATLGQTDFVQQLNRQRALEGELARTIRSLDGVTFARVHLNLPRRQLFEEEAEPPSGSVTIGVGGRKPTDDQVQAVQNLVAGAVPGLKAEQVSVIDQHGKTLSVGGSSMTSKLADDRKSEVERKLAARIKELVEGVVGVGRSRVEVSADIDMARVTEQETTYDPDGQVIRSEQTGEENARENDPAGADGVSAGGNIPGVTGVGAAGGNSSTSGSTQSTTNYEISNKTRTEVREPGAIKKISVAVAVDGVTAPGANGKPGAYTPRSAEELARLDELVKAAVGFDTARGDTVKVTNVRFAREAVDTSAPEGGLLSSFDKNDIMRVVELAVLGIVAVLIMIFGVRPLLKSLVNGGGARSNLPALAGSGGGPLTSTRLVTTPDGAQYQIPVDPSTGEPLALPSPDLDQRIDIARIEGQVRASSVKRVADFVDKHPEESVSILRTWLHETT
ncbi:MAG TPA: flagellar basal-body MS-ring/collar protein FliF [Caulobacter sp.]|nr:flagellar basal-body MS-ring/collar protein FliF [Caulobacter sp.]